MQFSSDALDKIATDLSQFVDPSIPPLVLHDDKTLQTNILESVIGILSNEQNTYARFLVTNFVRRIHASIKMYAAGRTHAIDYINGDRRIRLEPYFLALTHFECCVAYVWQVADLARNIAANKLTPESKLNLFDRGDGSIWERLHDLYTSGTKHSHDHFSISGRSEMPTTIWLTNDGISCGYKSTKVKFDELAEIIADNNNLLLKLQIEARARHGIVQSNSK